MTKRRILACVFTCCAPGKAGFTGGESLLGWSLLNQISRYHDVWALTQEADRAAVEESLAEYPSSNIHFEYVDLPFFLRPLLKIQGGHQIYYYLWQLRASFVARKLNKVHHFDLFHHITYANDWMANFIGAWLPIPYVRGPGGGAHRTPKSLQSEYSFSGRFWEKVRSMGQWVFRHDPVFIRSQNHASAILLCNQDSINSLSLRWTHKAHLFPVSGVSTEDLGIVKERNNGGPFQVVSAGSLLRIKGFGLAIKSFSEFSSKHPDSQLRDLRQRAGRKPIERIDSPDRESRQDTPYGVPISRRSVARDGVIRCFSLSQSQGWRWYGRHRGYGRRNTGGMS